ncbi:MAG: hypothetical protein A2W31_17365 [Planctomycetes bacterium RBG_16_64_10]|nr:MAG: hypothetical protein A2W31_17365 [Planctomycetes bacterium RBG_16_64_10]
MTQCVEWSVKRQQPYRDLNRMLVDAAMGQYYPRFLGAAPETMINLMWMTHRAISRFLYMRTPRGLVNTSVPQWKIFAEDAEIALNRSLQESNVGRVLSDVIDQALYSVGALFMSADYVGTPEGMKQVLVTESVPFPDLVWDAGARRMEDSDYLGRVIDVKLVDVREHPLFDPEERTKVEAEHGGRGDAENRANFHRPSESIRRDLYESARLYQVFDRPSGRLYVWPVDQPDVKLSDAVWNGPKHGPLRLLHFGAPPGHPFPVSPMMNYYRMARAANLLLVKAFQQEQAAKGLMLYTSAAKEDAQEVVDSVDLNSVLQEHGSVRWAHIGGAAPGTVSMAELGRRLFSYAVGNLDQLMGLSVQAPTASQERMLSEATGASMKDMGHTVFNFIKPVVEDMYWFNIRDGETVSSLSRPMGRTGLNYSVSWTPEKRRMIERMQAEIDVEPYSYTPRTPEGRLADYLGAVQIIGQFAPMMAAQGITMDVEAIVRTIAKYRDLPELYDTLILNQDPERLAALFGPRSGKEPMRAMGNTGPRRYIRESRSDGAAEGVELLRMMGQRGNQTTEAA